MDKINFQNKKLPAVNGPNLNRLQENIDKAKYEKTGGLIDGECIVADISSKNILDISLFPTVTYSGVTVTNNYDGSFTINGTATKGQEFAMNILITDKPGTYTFSVKKSTDVAVDTGVLVRNKSGQAVYNINTSTPTNEVLEGYYINKFYIYVNQGQTYNNLTIYPQLEKGNIATNWNKYINLKNTKKIITGQEIPTNEYIDGKQVYRKRVNFGTLPNNTTKRVAHNLTSVTFTKHFVSCINASGYNINLPYVDINAKVCTVSTITNTEIVIKSITDQTTYTAYVDLYYTKN